jgi:hypothetical protein
MINASARLTSIIIGSEDWTAYQAGFETGYSYISESGISATEGKLTLRFDLNDPNLPSVPDFERNPNQWHKGQTVQVQVSNDSGTLINHPCGKLYILGEPKSPSRSNSTIQLDLGCKLLLQSYPVPDRDKSGATAGSSNPSKDIVENYLREAGLSYTIATMPYPLNRPIAKTSGGSYVEIAGKIARERGYTLYCDSTGTVKNALIDLTAGSPVISITMGGDSGGAIAFDHNQGNEFPCEKLTISGTCPDISQITSHIVNILVTQSTVGALTSDPRFVNPVNYSSPVNFTTTITNYAFNGIYDRVTTEVTVPLLAVSDRYATGADYLNPTQASFEDERKFYDADSRLIQTTKTITTPQILVTPNPLFSTSGTYLTPIVKSSEIQTIIYSADGQISSITNVTQWARVAITDDVQLTNTINAFVLTNKASFRQSWIQLPLNRWSTVTEDREAKIIVDPDNTNSYDAFNLILKAPPSPLTANNGSSQPPALQLRSDATLEDRAYSVDVFFKPLAGAQFYERERAFTLQYLGDPTTAERQLIAYGQLQNAFITGLRFGRSLIIPLSNTLLSSCKPGMKLRVTDTDGWIYDLVLNAITFTHNQTEAIALLNCLTVQITSPGAVVTNPTQPISALISTFSQDANLIAALRVDPALVATLSQDANLEATLTNWVPYTPTENEAYTYRPAIAPDPAQTLDKINDGNTTSIGVLRLGTTGTDDVFEFYCTLASSQTITSIDFWRGQFNGAFNKPNQIEIYDGTSSGGTLLATIVSTAYGYNQYLCSTDAANWAAANPVTDLCFKCTLFDSAFDECAILELRINA